MQRMLSIGFLIFFLGLSPVLASGTYVPPVTSYVPTQASIEEQTIAPRSQPAPNLRPVRKTRAPLNDNRYNVGKKYLYRETNAGNYTQASCNSCHSGNSAFNRQALLDKKDRLVEIIQDCNGPHRVYCRGLSSNVASKADAIAYTLKIRYGLET